MDSSFFSSSEDALLKATECRVSPVAGTSHGPIIILAEIFRLVGVVGFSPLYFDFLCFIAPARYDSGRPSEPRDSPTVTFSAISKKLAAQIAPEHLVVSIADRHNPNSKRKFRILSSTWK